MKIAIVNRRYFESYGPERYLFQISDRLRENGHDVYPFSVRRKWNAESRYKDYFVSSLAGEDVLYFKDYKLSAVKKVKILLNAIYSFDAKEKMGRLISDHGVELLYLLGIVNDISPSVIDAAKKRGVPVVLRASDFYIFCPQYLFMRDSRVCRECEEHGYKRALKYRCTQGSLAATGARVISMYVHKWLRIYDKVDAVVTPSLYMRDAFIKAGFDEKKVIHVRSFFDSHDVEPCYENDGYILYFGRLDANKGVINLLKAYEAGGFDLPLIIAGTAADGEDERMMKYVKERNISNIDFVGFKKRDELIPLIQRAVFTVAPSIWPDNSPMSVLESMSCGTPVIGSDLGGIAEQITDECGILVPPNDPDSLSEAMASLLADPQKVMDMGQKGYQRVKDIYSIEKHYDKLISIFNRLVQGADV